jgi:hypothetical protein
MSIKNNGLFIERGKLKYPMKNPLHQNYGHIKVLEEKFQNIKITSLIWLFL